MISTTLLSACMIAQTISTPAPAIPGRVLSSEVAWCAECGVKVSTLAATIACLQTSPRGCDREDAAEALRLVKWSCHPEVVAALSGALLHDRDGSVRREAAESLTKLGACLPEAHFALETAARADRSVFVRLQAKRGLKSLSHRCVGECDVCAVDSARPVIRDLPGVPTVVHRGLATTEINAPGLHMVITPGRAVQMELGSPLRKRRVVPSPAQPEIVEVPAQELEAVPPADPTPMRPQPPKSPTPARVAAPAPVPAPSEPPLRRSSEKPVLPPTDLPPLIPPSSGSRGTGDSGQ